LATSELLATLVMTTAAGFAMSMVTTSAACEDAALKRSAADASDLIFIKRYKLEKSTSDEQPQNT
jgi:hypothetical protein